VSVAIPKAAIVFGGVTPPQGDILVLTVHLGCTKEVSSFSCLLENWDKKYSPGGTSPISVGMDGHIDIGRGIDVPQIITCRVEKVQCESPTPNEHYIRVSGRGWGERIFRRVVTKVYENKKGEDIVKDIIDYYVGLSHVRDEAELIEDTDTTYTYLEYENTPVFDILKYIAESSDKAGVIGYDFRVAPDGKFEFFPKNSKTSPVSLSEKIEVSEYRKDIHRVRNKIMIYGLADKSVPADKDAWTESLTPADGSWSAAAGEVSLDTDFKAKGSASIKVHSISMYWVGAIFTLNAGKEVNSNLYPLLSFLAYLEKSYNGNVSVFLYDTAGKYARKNITAAPGEWRKTDLRAGLANELEWEEVEAGFDWANIKKVRIDGWFSGVGSGDFWIDQLFFGGRRYSATREDSASQTNYGLRELVEVDEELVSDNECDLRARALLDYFKDPAEYLRISTTVLDYGNTPLLAADKIPVVLPNENVDCDFRIESVEYNVDAKTQTLEITLELGKVPPFLADYLYGMRATTVTVEKLARTKLGKGAIPTALGGGLGAHHVGHEAGDDNGVPWPSEDDGGWDKLTGWVCPKHIGPYEDEVAIIKFRTKNKAGTGVLDHRFQPSDNEHGVLGSEIAHWKELHSKRMVLYHGEASPYGDFRIKVQGEDNPKTRLTEELLEFGPGDITAPDVYLKRTAAGKLELKAQYLDLLTDNLLEIGSETKRVHKIFTTYLTLLTDGYMQIKTVAEDNPKAKLDKEMLQFGPGGATALDTWLKRVGSGQLELKTELWPLSDNSGKIGTSAKSFAEINGYQYGIKGNMIPASDNASNLGAADKRFAHIYAVEIHVSNMLFNFHLLPDADATYDLGASNKKWKDLYLSGALKALDAGVAVHLLPNATGTYDLGSSTKKWSNLYLNGVGYLGSLNVGAFEVITAARVLQNVTAAASIITSGRFPLARLPEGTAQYFLKAQGAGFNPMYALLGDGDIPNLATSKITSGQFLLARLPRGTSGYVLEAQGAGFDPMYVEPDGRYTPKSHTHSHGTLTGVGPDDHHAQVHNHAGETISPATVNCNNISIAASCNRQYSHPSSQQCVYASSVAWENCPHFGCVNYSAGDLCIRKGMRIPFINGMAITEAESRGLGPGFAFLNRKGKVIMVLDEDGNIEISGKIKEGVAV